MDWVGNRADVIRGPGKPGEAAIFRLAPKDHRVS